MQLGFRVQWSACYFLCGKETKTVHHQSKSRALQLHPTPFKTWNFNFLLQLFWRRMISISTLHPTFHSFITAQQPWQSASNQSNHKVVFGALPYTSFWPISPRDCQQFLATIWQPVGEYKFSLVTSGYHGITDRSLGLCDWDLNLQSQDEEVNHLGVQSRSANSGGLIMMPPTGRRPWPKASRRYSDSSSRLAAEFLGFPPENLEIGRSGHLCLPWPEPR